ncbi:vacuolar protein sorting/targeting protein PEP1, partial [Nowakowskiella sp. JEL0078]
MIADEFKHLVTKVSFDGGHQWRFLTPPSTDSEGKSYSCTPEDSKGTSSKCALHLNSITNPHNIGRVFSSVGAPGFVLGVGTVGTRLLSYDKGDTFLSIDGGLTWTDVAKGPHKYETVDQGSIIVLIPDSVTADYILISDDHGKKFQKYNTNFPKVSSWRVRFTNIDADSTSRKMVAWLTDSKDKNYLAQINFEKYFSSQCSKSDFEIWKPKHHLDGPNCWMGEETGYYRRKASSNCYVGKKFEQPKVIEKSCACVAEDFECDFNYARKEGKCVIVGYVHDQPADCPEGTTYKGKSGYRKIPNNKCEGGVDLEKHVDKTCKKSADLPEQPSTPDKQTGGGGKLVQPPNNKHPISKLKTFSGHVDKLYYINTTSIIFLRTDAGEIYRSDDEGSTWVQPSIIKSKGVVLRMGVHETKYKRVFFVFKNNDEIWLSDDALEGFKENTTPSTKTWRELKTPAKFNILGAPVLDFHPEEPDWLVFVGGGRACPDLKDCFTKTWISFDNGVNWSGPVETWAKKCLWGRDAKFLNKVAKDSVVCVSYKNKNSAVGQDVLGGRERADNPLQLVVLTNRGKDRKVVVDKGTVNFFVVDHVLVVAVLLVTSDAVKFNEAVFPPNIKVEKNGFTMLQSTTGGIFMDVSQNDEYGTEFGTLFESTEDGIYYSRSLQFTNRDSRGF